MVPFVLPTVVVGVAFRALFRTGGLLGWLGIDQSFSAVVIALVFFNVSVVVRTVGVLWEKLDPRQSQAAKSHGAGPLRAFFTVSLPQLAPGIGSAAALVALFCATAFGTVMILGGARYGTIETEIFSRTTLFLDLQGAAVLSLLQFGFVGLALWISNRATTRGDIAVISATSASDPVPFQWKKPADFLAALVAVPVVGGLIVLPLSGLVIRSFQDSQGQWTIANYLNLATNQFASPLQALLNSLRTAAIAMIIALVIGLLLALVLSKNPQTRAIRRLTKMLETFVMLPLGVSSVTVGFGFLITFTRPILGIDPRTSGWLIPLAQALVALPLVVRTIVPVLRSINPDLRRAASTLGASPWRILGTIDLALTNRALRLSAGFAFAVSLGEFGATSFLARPQNDTLPVLIFRLLNRPGGGNYGMALAAAVLLGAITIAIMIPAERLRRFGTPGGTP
jgi:thiamine transport system permease protein